MSVLKNIFSNFLICSPAIIISYAYYIEIINGLLFYISFILSLTLIIYFFSNQKKKNNYFIELMNKEYENTLMNLLIILKIIIYQ